MYIIFSIAIIAFIEMVIMLLFRMWELKRGRIDLAARMAFPASVIDHAHHHVKYHLAVTLGKGGKRVIRWFVHMFHHTKTRVGTETGITKMRDMVQGRGKFDSERGNASVYLKDITEHRNSVRDEVGMKK